jgi:hypothetical protein
METAQRAALIAHQLQAAGNAHFEYETNELHGVYDEQWSEWYAAYLLAHDWNTLFTRAWNETDLAQALRECNTAHRAHAPQTRWQDYYAEQFAQIA